MRLYIVRHADPDYPNNTITAAGHLEAEALGQRLAAIHPHRLYSSPLGRALHTMQYTAELTGLTPTVERWTQELGGLEVDLSPWGPIAGWELPGEIIRNGEEYPTHTSWHTKLPFEAPMFQQHWEAIQTNSDAFLERHGYRREGRRYRRVKPNRERIVVFCHLGFGLTWLAHLLDIPIPLIWSGFWLAPSSVTTVLFDERSTEWAIPRCIEVGDTSHLYAAGLPVRPRGIHANFE